MLGELKVQTPNTAQPRDPTKLSLLRRVGGQLFHTMQRRPGAKSHSHTQVLPPHCLSTVSPDSSSRLHLRVTEPGANRVQSQKAAERNLISAQVTK